MLQYIYDFFVSFFSLENASAETQAFLNMVITLGSVILACGLLYFVYWLVKSLFMFIFRLGR